MTMHCVSIIHLCVVLIVSWFGVINGQAVGHVIPQDPQLLVKSDANIADVHRDSGNGSSWQQMLLVLARDSATNQSQLHVDNAQYNDSSAVTTNRREETSQCKDGFIQLESRKCYLPSVVRSKWHEALSVCESLGSTLAYPMNAFENTVLANYLNANFNSFQGWWLGGTDEAKWGEWVWAHNKAPINYTVWLGGKPVNEISYHCMRYHIDYFRWRHTDCNHLASFVCQQ